MGMSNTTPGTIVKYANPQNAAEAQARFIVKEERGERVLIEFVCDLPIRPTECVPAADVVSAEPTAEQLAEQMKAEIRTDVAAGTVPATVSSFAELHDYVDANCYGGTEELFDQLVTESETDQEHQVKLDKLSAIMNPAMDIVDAWIKAGGLTATE